MVLNNWKGQNMNTLTLETTIETGGQVTTDLYAGKCRINGEAMTYKVSKCENVWHGCNRGNGYEEWNEGTEYRVMFMDSANSVYSAYANDTLQELIDVIRSWERVDISPNKTANTILFALMAIICMALPLLYYVTITNALCRNVAQGVYDVQTQEAMKLTASDCALPWYERL